MIVAVKFGYNKLYTWDRRITWVRCNQVCGNRIRSNQVRYNQVFNNGEPSIFKWVGINRALIYISCSHKKLLAN